MKTIRISLLALIFIGLGLIVTEKLWVPNLVNVIMQGQIPPTPEQARCNSIATQVLETLKTTLGYKPYGDMTIKVQGHYSGKFKSCIIEETVKLPDFSETTIEDQDNQKDILDCSISTINPSIGPMPVCNDDRDPANLISIDPSQISVFEQEYMKN